MNFKPFFNRHTIEAITSLISAIVCLVITGCRLGLSELQVKNLEVEMFSTNSMFHVEH